jgi:hypothetical protein
MYCLAESLERRQLLATAQLDVGPLWQARQPDWTAWSCSGNSSLTLVPLGASNSPTITMTGSALSWTDYSASKIVANAKNLLYRDGVSNAGDITLAFSSLAAGTYSLSLSSVDYGTAGSSASPWAGTYDVRVLDLTRTATTTVLANQRSATLFSIASSDLPAITFSPRADGTATITLRRVGTTGSVWLNGLRLSDGVSAADATPPTSAAPAWATAPAPLRVGVAAVTMSAFVQSDPSGVEYYFENVGTPSRNSGWIATPSWTDLQVAAASTQQYRFRVRDRASTPNTSPWSTTLSAATASDNSFLGFASDKIGTRRPAFDFTGMRAIPRAPAPGVHPRVFTSPEELPELRNRLATTVAGQEMLANIASLTRLLDVGNAGYNRSAPYASDAWGVARINNVGYYDMSATYDALINYDWNASPAPANPLPVTSTGTYDGGARNRLASLMTLAAFECWIFQGQPEYDQRALDLARGFDNWYRLIQADANLNSNNRDIFGGSTTALAYDFLHNVMTPAQRDNVRTGVQKITWSLSQNYGLDAVPYATTSNWSVLNDFAPVMVMAVEGEPGSVDADAYLREFLRVQYNFLTYGWYSDTGAPMEGLGKNYQGLSNMEAFARRGYYLVGHPAVKSFVNNYLPKAMQPYGFGFNEYDDWGGSGRWPVTGGYKYASEDAVGAKWLFPDNPTVDFVYRNYMGVSGYANPYASYILANPIGQKPFAPQGYANNMISAAIQAMDISGVADWNTANAAAQGGSLTFFEPNRGLLNTRSDYTSDALGLYFSSRQDLGGHTHADRNNFNLSALGRLWGIYRTESSSTGPTGNVLSESQYHSVVLIDGKGMGINDEVVGKQPGKVVSVLDQPIGTFVAADASYAYDWEWEGHLGSGNPIGPTTLPVRETLNQFRRAKSTDPWYDEPLYDRPFWNGGGDFEQFIKIPFNAMRHAYRTAGVVRGTNPYALVLDDYQKDDAVRNYKWLMQLADDLSIESTTVNLDPNNYRNDVVLTEASGNRRLLVRVIQNDGQAVAGVPATIDSFPDPRYGTSTWKRLLVESNSVAPNFKVMLFPFTVGQALPTTKLAAGGFTNTIGTQVDVVSYAPGADGRTRYTLSRGTTTIAEPADTAPAAPSGLIATPDAQWRINLSWTDNASNEQLFKIERSSDGGATFTVIDTTLEGVTSYTDITAVAGTTYQYRVRAANRLESAASNTVVVRAWPTGVVLVQAPEQTYRQNFDTLLYSLTWNLNYGGDAWLPGWSVGRSDPQPGSTAFAPQFRYDNGAQTFPRPLSLGTADGVTTQTKSSLDRGLGGIVGANGWHTQGVQFQNALSQTVQGVDVGYAIELWRRNTNATSLRFFYKLSSTQTAFDLASTTTGWTQVTALDYAAPTGTAATLDGNAPANLTTRNTSLNINVPAGQYLWIGWRMTGGGTSSNATIAVDDVRVRFKTAPVVAVAPAIAVAPITAGVPATASVLGSDELGEPALSYVWAAVGAPPGTVTFAPGNGGNSAKSIGVTFARSGVYTLQVTITDGDGLSTTTQLAVTVRPAPSSVPDLAASSDAGVSDTDNVTQRRRPEFSGTAEAGATLTLLVDGASVGSVVVAANGTWSLTPSADLADGSFDVQARVGSASGTSDVSGPLRITIDGTAPTWSAGTFDFAAANHAVRVDADELLFGFTPASALVVGVPGGAIVTMPASLGGSTITFQHTGRVSDGRYRATLAASSATDLAGNAVPAWTFDFAFLLADLDGDGAVNFDDLLRLAANYNTASGATYSQGDINADGAVDFDDLLLLAARYNTSLPSAPAPLMQPVGPGSGDDDDRDDGSLKGLV